MDKESIIVFAIL